MRTRGLVLALSLLSAPCEGQWKTHDVILATTAMTFAFTDYFTTMDSIHRCYPYGSERHCFQGAKECVEGNPLIGCFPSPAKFRTFALVGMGAELFIGAKLHGWKRTLWFSAMTATSFVLTSRNISNGWHLTVRL